MSPPTVPPWWQPASLRAALRAGIHSATLTGATLWEALVSGVPFGDANPSGVELRKVRLGRWWHRHRRCFGDETSWPHGFQPRRPT